MRLLRVPLREEGDTRLTKLIKVVRLPDHSFTLYTGRVARNGAFYSGAAYSLWESLWRCSFCESSAMWRWCSNSIRKSSRDLITARLLQSFLNLSALVFTESLISHFLPITRLSSQYLFSVKVPAEVNSFLTKTTCEQKLE